MNRILAAAPYVVVHDAYGALPVNSWVYQKDARKAVPTYGKTPKMIEFFNRTFGYDYPWQKYDQMSDYLYYPVFDVRGDWGRGPGRAWRPEGPGPSGVLQGALCEGRPAGPRCRGPGGLLAAQ